jgi:hypothetical protein
VYLKNGSVFRGVIIEQVPNQSIKIEIADGNIFVCPMDDILKITKELPVGSEVSNRGRVGTGLKRGFKGIGEFAYLPGIDGYSFDRLKLNVIGGYQINPYISLGVGSGLRYYMDTETALTPVFADFRFNFINRRVSPFLAFDLGYSFDAGNDARVGSLVSFMAGISIKFANGSALIMGLEFESQERSHYTHYYDDYYYSTGSYGALGFSMGVTF